MPREVEYRDFPGGPIRIEFSDELPHWNMCAPCGMLSAEMYKDEGGHFFCRACVDANSQRKRIFCKHENRDVQLSNLNEATELVLSTQELTVFCPNKKLGCTKYCHLNNMKQHLVECPLTPNRKCKACDTMLPMKDLRDHEALCPETYIQCNICNKGISRRTYEHHRNECQRLPELSKRGPREKKSVPSASSASAPASLTGPEVASIKGHDPSTTKSITDEDKESCQFCERPVKKCNYEKHLQVCVKREEECSHCSLPISREDWKTHEDVCEKNPENIKRESAPSVCKLGEKGKKNLTSDNEAKNSWSPKQRLHSDKNTSKNSSYEIITHDEVEDVAETKTENKRIFGGPASKQAGTSAASQYSPKPSTGNAMRYGQRVWRAATRSQPVECIRTVARDLGKASHRIAISWTPGHQRTPREREGALSSTGAQKSNCGTIRLALLGSRIHRKEYQDCEKPANLPNKKDGPYSQSVYLKTRTLTATAAGLLSDFEEIE